MTKWLDVSTIRKTDELLAHVLVYAKSGERVQFLVDPSAGPAIVQRMRVALSRSRKRNQSRGKPIDEFTLQHEIYPHTKEGKRYDCVVMWTEKHLHHRTRELLDDLVERAES